MTREDAGVSLGEASKDLDIKEVILENIEDGNIGCFKDIYVLKDYIYEYAKYLGINPEKIIDEFNEYMFEYTSKIPVKEIEKMIRMQEANKEVKEISSPYTKDSKKANKNFYVLVYSLVVLIVIFGVFLGVKHIIVNEETASIISYVK
jgi:cytoskeletal protein RodZ